MPSKENIPSDESPDDFLKKVGRRLKALRISKGYTNYEQFAHRHNINRSQYGRYEQGANITLATLIEILKALDIDPKGFFSEGFD
jgi:transcriptional regulator with XRE-family HTH domain